MTYSAGASNAVAQFRGRAGATGREAGGDGGGQARDARVLRECRVRRREFPLKSASKNAVDAEPRGANPWRGPNILPEGPNQTSQPSINPTVTNRFQRSVLGICGLSTYRYMILIP